MLKIVIDDNAKYDIRDYIKDVSKSNVRNIIKNIIKNSNKGLKKISNIKLMIAIKDDVNDDDKNNV